MTMTTLAETSFDDAVAFFRNFLNEQGETAPILWVFKEDVFSRKAEVYETAFWIKLPIPPDNETFAGKAFALAQQRNVGAGLSALARCEEGLCCSFVIPVDEEDAQYLMMSPAGVRYNVVNDMPRAKGVRSWLRWNFFSLFPFFYKQGNFMVYLLSKKELSERSPRA
jgi:hypothetical protein